jgi:hypothetical protein
MSVKWQEAYAELKKFISRNPQIEIGMNAVVIPSDLRTEFYLLFDATRATFLKERYQSVLDEAFILRRSYARVATEIVESLGLSEIKVSSKLKWFLDDPVDGLIRSLFDPLFALLKGKTDANGFEHEAAETVDGSSKQLLKLGYEKWALLSLVSLLAPDRALAVPTEGLDYFCPKPEVDQRKGVNQAEAPGPKETKSISLERGLGPPFVFPDIIVRSAELNRYVSITDDLTDATWTATKIGEKGEWCQIREIGRPYKPMFDWPDMVIHIDDQPEDIGLVADFGRFCRPDIIVECREEKDWYEKGGLERVEQDYDFLKPRLGSYIVTRFPAPDEAFQALAAKSAVSKPTPDPAISKEPLQSEAITELTADTKIQTEEESKEQFRDIHILRVGYEALALSPIIEALRNVYPSKSDSKE